MQKQLVGEFVKMFILLTIKKDMLLFLNERISLILSWRRDWPYEAQQPAVHKKVCTGKVLTCCKENGP